MLLTVDDRTPESLPIISQYKALVYAGNAHYHFNEYKKAEVRRTMNQKYKMV